MSIQLRRAALEALKELHSISANPPRFYVKPTGDLNFDGPMLPGSVQEIPKGASIEPKDTPVQRAIRLLSEGLVND